MTSAKRNEPCPCGSGLKYKRCCEGQDGARRSKLAGLFAWGMLVLFVGALAIAFTGNRESSGPAVTPADWYYDAAKDQHWDPRPGHEHWHKGLPPVTAPATPAPDPLAPAAGLAAPPRAPVQEPAPAAEPEAWDYDPTTDRHWDPNRKSWQPGLPSSE